MTTAETEETEETKTDEVALSRLPEPAKVENAFGLPTGAVDINGLSLGGNILTYEEWERMGHQISQFGRWTSFAIGDWLNWGMEAFAESDVWAQATEATPSERYDVGNRVTGLRVETLRNYSSVCNRVPIENRRSELSFRSHDAVAALDLEDQVVWLDRAVDNGWDSVDLREAIRDSKTAPPADDDEPGTTQVLDPPLSIGERIEQAARLVYNQGQPTSEGGALVPAEPWAQLAAALGEE